VLGCLTSPLPASAWTLATQWALHVAAPWALWPAIRRRPHLVVAGLLAGLLGECLLVAGQMLWERPHLAQQLASDPALRVEQRVADQFQARIGSWRLEGTFLLANTLATYLLLIVPLVTVIAWRSRNASRWWRMGSVLLALAALVVLGLTGSKAGILAGVVAGAVGAIAHLRSWHWRVAIGLTAGVMLVMTVLIAPLRQALAGSAGVRLDYWSAGVALVAERPLTGHGLDGFAVEYPRVKPPAGEETIIAHQETLQAAVDLGLPAMVILIAWWITILHSLRPGWAPPAMPAEPAPNVRRLGRTTLIGLPVLLLFGLLQAGILRADFAAYPGAMPDIWMVAFVVVLTAFAQGAIRLPLPSSAACWCAVFACLVHVQADFSLHSMQVVGVLAWVVMLGQALDRAVEPPPSAYAGTLRQGVFAVAGLVVLLVTAAGVMATSLRGEVLDRARGVEAIMARLRLSEQGRMDEAQRVAALEAFERAYARAVVEEREAAVAGDPREGLALVTIREAVAASRRFPADHDLVFMAVAIGEHFQALLPQRSATLTPILEELLAAWPRDLLVTKALSEHYLRLARAMTGERQHVLARQAQALAKRAVEFYPTHLPLRQTLIKAAELSGDQATVQEQRAEIARLEPLVHRDNRPVP
jgi:hypothetical protein